MNNLLNTKDKKALLIAIENNLDDFYIKCSNHPNFDLVHSDKIFLFGLNMLTGQIVSLKETSKI